MKWFSLREYRRYLKTLRASDPRIFERWVNENGIDKYTGAAPCDLARYLKHGGRGCRLNLERPPCTDHARLFKNSKTGKVWFVSQPYDSPKDAMQQVLPWAKEKGLTATVYSPNASWYNPGSTCLIVIEGGSQNGKRFD